jgi:hypothetical protein
MRSYTERRPTVPAAGPRQDKGTLLVSVEVSIPRLDDQVKSTRLRRFLRTLLGWRLLIQMGVRHD